ncbi:hypothetical protein R1flu_000380 [Riccia fluitans]|uniref:Uncharacterized protein n=1 Tax=Riccia fluitans TaxID=41844 RepID=A0ABD1Y099_9MARC
MPGRLILARLVANSKRARVASLSVGSSPFSFGKIPLSQLGALVLDFSPRGVGPAGWLRRLWSGWGPTGGCPVHSPSSSCFPFLTL